jgi:hypothetical protein
MKHLRFIAGIVGVCIAQSAMAVSLPSAPCDSSQFGCGGGAANIVMQALTTSGGIASLMLQICAGIAVLYVMWAGLQMLLSLGDEGKITQYKWGMAYAMIGLSVSILAQFVISAVGTENYGQTSGGGNLPIIILTRASVILRAVLNAVFIMMLVIAGLKMLYSQGKSDDYNSAKKMLYWGMAGAVFVNLSAALIYAVASFFGVL